MTANNLGIPSIYDFHNKNSDAEYNYNGKWLRWDELSIIEQEELVSSIHKDVQNSNCDYPIIVTKIKGKFHILDGNHRYEKARTNNIPLKVIYIPESDLEIFIT